MTEADVHLYQIAYSAQTLAEVEPGFAVLDNLANPRPDWFEYVPVRDFLMSQPMDEEAFYGFFSPKFGRKTGWAHADVVSLIHGAPEPVDVALLSAHPNQIAFFMNVFEQGEFFHPGLAAVCAELFEALGIKQPVQQAVMDVKQTVFCNYFVAKPAFWRVWLHFGEKLFAICEGPESPLQHKLTARTQYSGGVQMKVFVMERLASLALLLNPAWRTRVADPYFHGRWPIASLRDDPTQAIVSDALKHAYRVQRFPEYMQAFSTIRREIMTEGRT